jgi:acetyltransferase-like isoleucine patch superfamily enzyme
MAKRIGQVEVGEGARIEESAVLGYLPPGGTEGLTTVLGREVQIGWGTVVYAGARLGDGVCLGHHSVIGPDVVLEPGCRVGNQSTVQFCRIGEESEIGDCVVLGVQPQDKYDYRNLGGRMERLVIVGRQSIIRSHSTIYAKTVFGERLNCGHGARIRECTVVGERTTIGTNAQIEGFVTIGSHCIVQTNSHIGQFSVVEDEVFITAGAVLTNTLHPLCPKAKACMKGPVIKRGAKVSVNVTVAPDVTVGEDALIGAGAVVVEDVEPGTVVAGVPARKIKSAYELTCPYELIDRPYRRRE